MVYITSNEAIRVFVLVIVLGIHGIHDLSFENASGVRCIKETVNSDSGEFI